MLEVIPPPQTKEEKIAALFNSYRDIVARCPETGAELERTRKQWVLVYGHEIRHKPRWNARKGEAVTLEQAIQWGNGAIARIVKAGQEK